ncbi:shikimate kinase [Flavobacterium sp. 7A]|uniref:shikimate kinase n=1 Tax=Flavobacterium sp. 7A TaxID=2940571 RepID=UPI0022265EF1|nr:shikimate kinase [Flavobacterium sp. 7A]MCW2119538.1 shikimate kinase [Flavobacterium sp. 7A]
MNKIILLGYMGSGKSTIAKSLSKIQQVPYVDLDQYIEKKVKMTIKNIFETKGEIYFRKLEHQYFVELLENDQDCIIGLGGGTPCYANNHELLVGEGRTSIYLKASIDTLFDRLKVGKAQRPLIADKTDEEMKEFIAIHLFERSYFYNQAQHTVVVDHSIDQIVADIVAILK